MLEQFSSLTVTSVRRGIILARTSENNEYGKSDFFFKANMKVLLYFNNVGNVVVTWSLSNSCPELWKLHLFRVRKAKKWKFLIENLRRF